MNGFSMAVSVWPQFTPILNLEKEIFKGALSGLRQFFANESRLNWWKMLFILP